jgi:hypothetical protein
MSKSAEELFRERAKRVDDAFSLRIPDRIPLEIAFGYFPAKYVGGITCEAAYYDYDAWLSACKKTVADFAPDIASVQPFFPGRALELIDPKAMMWPGHGTSSLHSHQFLEGEFMLADEYPALLRDQSDFLLRQYLPRSLGAMGPFAQFPSLAGPIYGHRAGIVLADAFASPEISSAVARLQEAGKEIREWRPKMEAFDREIRDLGFPPFFSDFAFAPFDALSDHLRGMRGSMLDMYRQPDAVLEACDVILKRMVDGIGPAKPGGVNTVSIPLHRGSEGFMSMKQFEKFYWPGLKGLILALIDKGQRPLVFFEGDYTSRLEYLLELPKGSIFAHMDTTDIFKAKEILGGHLCISGNVPCSLVGTGTPDSVREYARKMIDVCGKDGGFIMSTRSPVDDANPECLKALIDFTIEYGVYR